MHSGHVYCEKERISCMNVPIIKIIIVLIFRAFVCRILTVESSTGTFPHNICTIYSDYNVLNYMKDNESRRRACSLGLLRCDANQLRFHGESIGLVDFFPKKKKLKKKKRNLCGKHLENVWLSLK